MKFQKRFFLGFFMMLAGFSYAQSSYHKQDSTFSSNSLKLQIGLGFSDGYRETGVGSLFAVGYQKNFWKNRLRLNPNLRVGIFSSRFIGHARDEYYNTISLEVNTYLDLLRYKAVSLFIGAGGLVNNTRGLFGTGGENQVSGSEYYSKSYYGANLGVGIRINPKGSPLAVDLMPVNIQLGNDYFLIGFFQLGVDIKLK